MAFDELSFMEWLGILAVGLPVAVLTVAFVLNFSDAFNTSIQGSDAVGQAQKDQLDALNTQQQSIWDYAFLFLFVGVAIAVVLVARSTQISPFWWVFLLFILAIVSLSAAWISNFYETANIEGSLGIASMMPIMHHITSYWLAYILAVGFAALVFSRSGPGGDF